MPAAANNAHRILRDVFAMMSVPGSNWAAAIQRVEIPI
jgi:hypothetical protein